MQPVPSNPAPTCWGQMQASGLPLCWWLQLGLYYVCVCVLLVMLPSEISKIPTDPPWGSFLLCRNFSAITTSSPGWVFIPKSFVSVFVFLYFVLPPFEENGLPFWVPGVIYQHSEVVLWKLINIRMIFWWISRGKSCLPVLFFCHLGHPTVRQVDSSSSILLSQDSSRYSRCFVFPYKLSNYLF